MNTLLVQDGLIFGVMSEMLDICVLYLMEQFCGNTTLLKCLLIFILRREKRRAEMITANKSVSELNSLFHNSVENMVNETPITEKIEALCS